MQWVANLLEQTKRIVSCYEAGCFGYILHRKLEAIGIENLVVRPRNWDEGGTKRAAVSWVLRAELKLCNITELKS